MTATGPDSETTTTSPATFAAREGEESGTWILAVTGEIDVATSPELRRELHQLADREPTQLVLDLEGVSFIDSSGLGVLVGVLKRLREEDRGDILVLEGLQEPVRKVFDITGLTELFTIR
ncbi:MAG TPA: STAS domain-containing protein [Acidimicrobiia bacterium]|nr:STAS domain-containing protein [Acidimicrobiia bacterium]